ncbi:RiPP maturation radical SAM protein 1 [Ktedonobacter sp. SOSP1-52]|uniref:RiPP maturation radical SAM C-methyltransferase n=1 Tax=Ktedonobacter sp. SOSP1-52 TaxID=2778366 RepID=UPI0019169A67|nr:RiPP maturation radical SAM C-methyltransferase [Ktedonobacter sp. SOSP1-52]GHO70221.1 RiPP maturation radical SAM protein 1 [Ktedonobacter sp. SOSP1-52]
MRIGEQVLFMSMPFASSRRPSLGLSLLQAKLQESSIPSFIWYPFLPFVPKVGTKFYEEIADGKYPSNYLLGEWIFAPWLMSDPQDSSWDSEYDEKYLQYLQQPKNWLDVLYSRGIAQEDADTVRHVRQLIPAFFEDTLNAIEWDEIQFVGFTSVFQQHVASLAFARILKERYPHLTIVFGGANVEGPMGRGLLRSFPWIDAVVSGEGENIIIPLVKAVLNKEDYAHVPGVWTRRTVASAQVPAVKMDELPYPIFEDFFAQHNVNEIKDSVSPSIMVETSRGCWWGQRSHCTFCGLNGLNMAFRSKSPERALREITELWDRYADRAANVLAVDNILDYRYINTLLPQLAQHPKRFSLFYETKANLKKQQIANFAEAHIDRVQPGIESLSTHVLKVMRKGVSALNNVQMLKWCHEYGITPYWNILWGFPGEQPEDYAQANEWAKRIFHLRPPVAFAPVRLDRFSPLFNEAQEFGIKDIKPTLAYEHIFPGLSPQERFDLAYFFDYDYQEKPGSGYTTDLIQTVRQWTSAHSSATLFYCPVGTRTLLVDTRTEQHLWLLDQEYLELLDALDAIAIKSDLAGHLNIDPEMLSMMLQTLDEHHWIIQEENRVLGLAIRLGRYQPSGQAQRLLASIFDGTGQATVAGHIRTPVAVS